MDRNECSTIAKDYVSLCSSMIAHGSLINFSPSLIIIYLNIK